MGASHIGLKTIIFAPHNNDSQCCLILCMLTYTPENFALSLDFAPGFAEHKQNYLKQGSTDSKEIYAPEKFLGAKSIFFQGKMAKIISSTFLGFFLKVGIYSKIYEFWKLCKIQLGLSNKTKKILGTNIKIFGSLLRPEICHPDNMVQYLITMKRSLLRTWHLIWKTCWDWFDL